MRLHRSGDLEIRPATPDQMVELVTVANRAFGDDIDPEETARDLAALAPERTLACFDAASIVGVTALYSFDMTVPGGPTPVAGVTMVGVLPTHRRRGILTSLMRQQLVDLQEQQAEPVAALWAAEAPIYPRFGYGLATRRLAVKAECGLPFAAGTPALQRVQLVDPAAARSTLTAIHDRARIRQPGMLTRSVPRWDTVLDDSEFARTRQGGGSLACALAESGNGYVLYRTKGDFSPDWIAAGKVVVREFIATDAGAHATLWRYLLDLDLMTTVQASHCSIDDPLQHLVADARRLHPTLTDALWVRLVDVKRALATRTYAVDDSVVIEVVDDFCPWNAGRVSLDVSGRQLADVGVRRTDRSADITLSAAAIGAIYLGGTRARSLAAAGLIDEHSAGSVARVDRLFAGDVEPWCPEVF